MASLSQVKLCRLLLTVLLTATDPAEVYLVVRQCGQGRRQGFRPGWAKFSFAHPGFQFAHPAIRNGCQPCPPYRGGFKGKGIVGH